jgi:hypothetical protein
MYFSRLTLIMPVLALFSLTTLAIPHGNLANRQSRPDNHTLNRERSDAVKAAFEFAWNGYKKYAFPHDELHPVSNSYSDSRYSHQYQTRNSQRLTRIQKWMGCERRRCIQHCHCDANSRNCGHHRGIHSHHRFRCYRQSSISIRDDHSLHWRNALQ